MNGTKSGPFSLALCRSRENINTSAVCTKKSITPSRPKSVTRIFPKRQLKNFAR